MMNEYEAEIRQMIADVMRDTGIRIDVDDPIIAMLFAQKRELGKFLEQSSDKQTVQHEQFLADFQARADSIIAAAAELQTQKQQLLAELLQTNAKERNDIEQKLFGNISQRMQKQFQTQANDLVEQISGSLKIGMMIWAVVQILIFAVMFFLLKK